MEFYLDTANADQIQDAHDAGLLDGVTTNPSLIAAEGHGYIETLERICQIVGDKPVNAECIEREYAAIVEEGRRLAKIADNITVKIALDRNGLKATRTLASEGIAVNNTLCFSPMQALIAAKSGAAYVSPFVGRLDDISQEGMELIEQIRMIFDNYGLPTKIIVASIRNPTHALSSALIGADIATLPYKVFEQLFRHPLTDIGIERFLADYAKIPKEAMQG